MVYVIDGTAHAGHKPQGDEYRREATKFSLDGALDLSDAAELHLYVCAACPWAHRALITRNLSATLRAKVTVSVVSPFRDDAKGWEFLSDANRAAVAPFRTLPVTADASPLGAATLLEVYLAACPAGYTGNVTTPVLYDARSGRILSNDSFGIMRLLARAAPELARLYPAGGEGAIDAEARAIDAELAQRVYMCGLAKTQPAYEGALARVCGELARLEALLGGAAGRRRLGGGELSLADIGLLACLVRFDPVYFDLFKCFARRLASYPALAAYARSVAAEVGVEALALDLPQVTAHYWTTFTAGCNPNGVVPIAYQNDFLDGGIDQHRDGGGGGGGGDGGAAAAPPAVLAAGAGAEQAGTEQDQADKEARKARGEFVRGVSAHRNWLGDDDFPVEPGRYVLFVSNNCPWCHRTMMARALYKGMEQLVRKLATTSVLSSSTYSRLTPLLVSTLASRLGIRSKQASCSTAAAGPMGAGASCRAATTATTATAAAALPTSRTLSASGRSCSRAWRRRTPPGTACSSRRSSTN